MPPGDPGGPRRLSGPGRRRRGRRDDHRDPRRSGGRPDRRAIRTAVTEAGLREQLTPTIGRPGSRLPGPAGPLAALVADPASAGRHRPAAARLHRVEGGLRADPGSAGRRRLPSRRDRPARPVRVTRAGRRGCLHAAGARRGSAPPWLLELSAAGRLVLLGHSFGGLVARGAVLAGAAPVRADPAVLRTGGAAGRSAAGLAGEPASRCCAPRANRWSTTPRWRPAAPPGNRWRRRSRRCCARRFLASSAAGLLGMGGALQHEPDRVDELNRGPDGAPARPVAVVAGVDDDAWSPAEQADMARRLGTELVGSSTAPRTPLPWRTRRRWCRCCSASCISGCGPADARRPVRSEVSASRPPGPPDHQHRGADHREIGGGARHRRPAAAPEPDHDLADDPDRQVREHPRPARPVAAPTRRPTAPAARSARPAPAPHRAAACRRRAARPTCPGHRIATRCAGAARARRGRRTADVGPGQPGCCAPGSGRRGHRCAGRPTGRVTPLLRSHQQAQRVRVGRLLAEPQHLVAAVVVRRAGGQQAQPVGDLPQLGTFAPRNGRDGRPPARPGPSRPTSRGSRRSAPGTRRGRGDGRSR